MLALALLGMILSGYALTFHYADGGRSLCDINARFSCDTVNKSAWSTVLGIPVALLGILGYAAVALLALKRGAIQRALAFTHEDWRQDLLLLIAAMAAFQLYLTFVEAYFIGSYCVVCLASQVVVLALLGFVWKDDATKNKYA